MKLLSILLFVFIVSACSSEIGGNHVNRAVEFCKDKGGVIKITTVEYYIFCADGTYTKSTIKKGYPK